MNENIKKLLGIVAGVAALVTVIIGGALLIGKSSKNSRVITLHYWGLWEPKEVMQPLIDEYEKLHPNIKIEYVQKYFGNVDTKYVYKGNYQDAIEERLKRSGGVDIIRIHSTWVPKYIKYLMPAPSSLLTATQLKDDFYPALVNAVTTSSGKVYAMPLYIDGLVLFYNKALLQKAGYAGPPQTWDDAIAYAKTLTKRDEHGNIVQAGLGIGAVGNVLHSPQIIMLMLTQAGVPIVNLQTKSFGLDSQEAAAALEFYYSFQKKEKVWDFRLPTDLQFFAQGKLAMMLAPAWRIQDVLGLNQNLDFDIPPVPVLAGATPEAAQYLTDVWVEAVPKNSKYAKYAWQFLVWLAQPEQLKKLFAQQSKLRAMGEPYPRISMASLLENTPYASVVVKMAPSMKTWPIMDIGIWETQFKAALTPLENRPIDYANVLKDINANLNNLVFGATK